MATFSGRFDASDRLPSVPVKIDGEGPFDFGLHPGSPGAIGSELAALLRLPPADLGRVRVASYDIGHVRVASDFQESVRDLSRLWLGPGKPAYGIIGYNALAGLETTIDHPRSTVSLGPSGRPVPAGLPVIRMRLHPDPTACRLPIVAVRVDGWISARMFLDTGLATTLISPKLRDQLTGPDTPAEAAGDRSDRVVLESITLGHPRTRRLRDVICQVGSLRSRIPDRAHAQLPVDGVVGKDLLGGFRITLDYRASRILLE